MKENTWPIKYWKTATLLHLWWSYQGQIAPPVNPVNLFNHFKLFNPVNQFNPVNLFNPLSPVNPFHYDKSVNPLTLLPH